MLSSVCVCVCVERIRLGRYTDKCSFVDDLKSPERRPIQRADRREKDVSKDM
ncbi:Uncharacterized protein APZ42_032677 [Daphnia magna]|uniref:Uncharacterized protein n=1 Tax=Daphnia magna TaxID=35525 RepID=A0A164LSI3_9CRUS|nr:Uncharacterized protein APZ42_032677 [Daphnia magna]